MEKFFQGDLVRRDDDVYFVLYVFRHIDETLYLLCDVSGERCLCPQSELQKHISLGITDLDQQRFPTYKLVDKASEIIKDVTI